MRSSPASMRVLLLSLLLASVASAQEPTFQFAQGPWRTDHALIGVLSDGTVLGSVGDQLIASDDGGLSWAVRQGVAVPLAVVEHEGDLVGVFGAEGIRRSTDGARSWGAPEAVGGEVRFVASGGGALWAAGERAAFRFLSGRWENASAPLEAQDRVAGITVADEDVVGIAITGGFTPSLSFAMRSLDGGTSWERQALSGCAASGAAASGRTLWFGRQTCQVGPGLFPGGLHRWPAEAVSTARGCERRCTRCSESGRWSRPVRQRLGLGGRCVRE